MGGGKGGTEVEGQNPYAVADADFRANNINQFTPAGNLQFTPPEVIRNGRGEPVAFGDQATARLTLDPEIQRLFDMQQGLDINTLTQAGVAQGALNRFLGTELAGAQGLGDVGQFRDSATDAAYERASGLLERSFGTRENELRQRMSNQGIPGTSEAAIGSGVGGEALGAFTAFENDRNEAYNRAALDAIGAGRQEAQLMAGLGQTDVNLRNAARGGQFNELASLLGLQQVAQPGLGNFFAPQGANVTGAFGLAQQADMANAQNAQGIQSGLLQGLFGLGAAGLGNVGEIAKLSDIRLKENVKWTGHEYEWEWNEEGKRIGADIYPTHGEIAQEVMVDEPERVFVGPHGYLMIRRGA